MSDSPAQFVERASGLRDGRAVPEGWATMYGERVASFAARSEEGRDVRILAVGTDATANQRETFERARSAWLAHAESDVIVSVVAWGDDPRPWLAIEPASSSTIGTVQPERVRSIMADLAEAFWLVESTGESPLPDREQIRLDAQAGTARICWPLDPGRQPGSGGVEQVGAIGYELLTGDEPPTNGPLDWVGAAPPPRLWHTIESALVDGEPDSCYELKRALLFGPATPPAMSASEPSPPADADQPTTESAGQGLPKQVSRRTAVGILGMGALGVTGLFARGRSTPDSNPEPALKTPPDASFEFEQGRTTMTVTHAGGDDIEASQLAIRNTRISGTGTYQWTDFEGYDDETIVTEGDSIVVDRGVLSMWYASIVWLSPDGETEIVLEKRKISEEDLYS